MLDTRQLYVYYSNSNANWMLEHTVLDSASRRLILVIEPFYKIEEITHASERRINKLVSNYQIFIFCKSFFVNNHEVFSGFQIRLSGLRTNNTKIDSRSQQLVVVVFQTKSIITQECLLQLFLALLSIVVVVFFVEASIFLILRVRFLEIQ